MNERSKIYLAALVIVAIGVIVGIILYNNFSNSTTKPENAQSVMETKIDIKKEEHFRLCQEALYADFPEYRGVMVRYNNYEYSISIDAMAEDRKICHLYVYPIIKGWQKENTYFPDTYNPFGTSVIFVIKSK